MYHKPRTVIPAAQAERERREAEEKSELEEQIEDDTAVHDEPESDVQDADEPESNDTDDEDDKEKTMTASENLVATSEMLYIDAKNVTATGSEVENGFVVCKGSMAVLEETSSLQKYFPKVVNLRKELIEQGILKLDTEERVYVFTQNYEFSTIVNAANAILGVSSSRGTWKNERSSQLRKTGKRK